MEDNNTNNNNNNNNIVQLPSSILKKKSSFRNGGSNSPTTLTMEKKSSKLNVKYSEDHLESVDELCPSPARQFVSGLKSPSTFNIEGGSATTTESTKNSPMVLSRKISIGANNSPLPPATNSNGADLTPRLPAGVLKSESPKKGSSALNLKSLLSNALPRTSSSHSIDGRNVRALTSEEALIHDYDAVLRWTKEVSSPPLSYVGNTGASSAGAAPSSPLMIGATGASAADGENRQRSGSILQFSRTMSFSLGGGNSFKRNGSIHAIDLKVLESIKVAADAELNGIGQTVEDPDDPLRKNSIQSMKGTGIENDVDPEDMETCLICMGHFTKKRPKITIPCTKECNLAPVHAKCIYEWKSQGSGNCPLCRSELGKVEYKPRDILGLDSLFMYNSRRAFITAPLPRSAGVVRMYIRVLDISCSGAPIDFQLFLQAPTSRKYPLGPLPQIQEPAEGDILLMWSQIRQTLNGTMSRWPSIIDISMDRRGRDFDMNGINYLASVYSSPTGLEYVAKVLNHPRGFFTPPNERVANKAAMQSEIVAIGYEQNRVGASAGPRKMHIAFPTVMDTEKSFLNSELQTYLTTMSSSNAAATVTAASQNETRPSLVTDSPLLQVQNSKSGIANRSGEYKPSFDIARAASSASSSSFINLGNPSTTSANSTATTITNTTTATTTTTTTTNNNNNNNNNTNIDGAIPKQKIEKDDEDEDEDDEDLQGRHGAYRVRPHIVSASNPSLRSYAKRKILVPSSPNVVTVRNKEPYYLESIQAFSLDFEGRVTLPSNKNFIVASEFTPDTNLLLFGKIGSVERGDSYTIYTLDVQWPLSPLQAFAIGLSSCDRKLFCA